MPLSVASVLARLGRDPWVEAGRLAQLPRDAATEALTAMIANLSPARVTPSEALTIAARLIQLLPSGATISSASQAGPSGLPRSWPNRLVLLFCLALLAFASFNLIMDRGPAFDPLSPVDTTSPR